MQVAWHYTTLENATLIEADGRLRPATAWLVSGEKPVIWFSLSQEWEPTATKWLAHESPEGTIEQKLATPAEMVEVAGGLVRYGVFPSTKLGLMSWAKIVRKAKIPRGLADSLELVAMEQGADPAKWLGRFKPLPISRCCRVEIFDVETVDPNGGVSGSWLLFSGIPK